MRTKMRTSMAPEHAHHPGAAGSSVRKAESPGSQQASDARVPHRALLPMLGGRNAWKTAENVRQLRARGSGCARRLTGSAPPPATASQKPEGYEANLPLLFSDRDFQCLRGASGPGCGLSCWVDGVTEHGGTLKRFEATTGGLSPRSSRPTGGMAPPHLPPMGGSAGFGGRGPWPRRHPHR